jgi:late competence protein required for DNA uptake (superfamily II DNA/RNA helicase)
MKNLENNKGEYQGGCNRSACDNHNAEYYNHSTRMYYCRSCVKLINGVNRNDAMRLFGHDLCTIGENKD